MMSQEFCGGGHIGDSIFWKVLCIFMDIYVINQMKVMSTGFIETSRTSNKCRNQPTESMLVL